MSFPTQVASIYLPSSTAVTSAVNAFEVTRGRTSPAFAALDAATGTLTLNNEDRAFDPLHSSSPYYGEIVPGRRVGVSSAGVTIFDGYVSDWSFEYGPDGRSIAVCKVEDGLAALGRQGFSAWTTTNGQGPGARLTDVLARPEVSWSAGTSLDTGVFTLGSETIDWGTNVLNYCQLVADSDNGLLFVARDGTLTFKDRLGFVLSSATVAFGTGGVGFSEITTSYGTELLFNRVTVSRIDSDPITVDDTTSIADYGRVYALSKPGLLMQDDGMAAALAARIVDVYGNPVYRFESITVDVHKLSGATQTSVLGLDLGDVVSVTWTPNATGSVIARTCVVDGIRHTVSADRTHVMELVLNDASVVQVVPYFTVEDATYGAFNGAGVLAYPIPF